MVSINVRADYGGDASDPVKWFRAKMAHIEDVSVEAVDQATDDGVTIMKELIETRGTGKTWSSTWFGGDRTASMPGRVDTGHMRDSVTKNPVKVSGKGNIYGGFGWLHHRDDYFAYQEGGFEHWRTGEYVEGMYAMVDAAELAFGQLQDHLRKGINGA